MSKNTENHTKKYQYHMYSPLRNVSLHLDALLAYFTHKK